MANLSTTTTARALDETSRQIYVASNAGMAVNQLLVVDREAMVIVAIPSGVTTRVIAERGAAGTVACSHNTASTVYFGPQSNFYNADPVGVPPTYPAALPWINLRTGQYFTTNTAGDAWIPTSGGTNLGNVVGPASSTDGALAAFNGTTGRLLKNGSAAVYKAAGLTVAAALKMPVVSGGAAGNFTVTGITTADQLVSVLYYAGAGTAVTNVTDLTSEFTITATNTINNTGGTASTGGKLVVTWISLH